MSFGLGQGMVISIRNNLKLKGKRKTYFDREVTKADMACAKNTPKQEMSPAQLTKFSRIYRLHKLRRQKRVLAIWIAVMIPLLSVLYYFLFLY